MTVEPVVPTRFPLSVIPVWALVAIGAVLVGLFVPRPDDFGWLTLVLFGGVLVTFVIQLGIDEKQGLVNRVIASLGGSVVILALATAAYALLA
ncbi:MAG: hypothetical protein V4479_05055 [Actinomycetota bacterium]